MVSRPERIGSRKSMKPTPTMNASADDQSSSIRVPPVATTRYHGAVRTASGPSYHGVVPPRRHRRSPGRLRHPGQRAHRGARPRRAGRRTRTAPPRTAPRPARTGRAAGAPLEPGQATRRWAPRLRRRLHRDLLGRVLHRRPRLDLGLRQGRGHVRRPRRLEHRRPGVRGGRRRGGRGVRRGRVRSRGRGERRRGSMPEVVVSGVVGSMPEVAGTPRSGRRRRASVPSSSGGEARANGMVGSSTGPPTGPAAARAERPRAQRGEHGGQLRGGRRPRERGSARRAGAGPRHAGEVVLPAPDGP